MSFRVEYWCGPVIVVGEHGQRFYKTAHLAHMEAGETMYAAAPRWANLDEAFDAFRAKVHDEMGWEETHYQEEDHEWWRQIEAAYRGMKRCRPSHKPTSLLVAKAL